MRFRHCYTFTPDWQQQVVDFFGARLIGDKLLIMPDKIGEGGSCFLELMPGFSVVVMDVIFKQEVTLTRYATKDDMCIIYYDLSDEISNHIINGAHHKIGYQSKLGMGVVDCAVESTYIPHIGERIYTLRLIISKKLLRQLTEGDRERQDFGSRKSLSEDTLFHYSHIDSRSKVALNRLKSKSFDDPAFDLLLRGVAYNLLGYLLENTNKISPIRAKISEKDIAGVMLTERYMLDHLLNEFPGINELATMAGMSVSKYKQLFKRVFGDSPNSFFLNEKLLLAQNLLESGNFNTVSEVAYELGYSKPGYFASAYRRKFETLPGDVLIKSNN